MSRLRHSPTWLCLRIQVKTRLVDHPSDDAPEDERYVHRCIFDHMRTPVNPASEGQTARSQAGKNPATPTRNPKTSTVDVGYWLPVELRGALKVA